MKSFLNLVFLITCVSFFASPALGLQSDDPAVVANRLPAVVELTDGSSVKGYINSIGETDVELSVSQDSQGSQDSQDSVDPLNLSFKQITSLNFQNSNARAASTDQESQSQGVVSFVDGSQAYFGSIGILKGIATITTVAGVSIRANVSNLKTISFLGNESGSEQKNSGRNF